MQKTLKAPCLEILCSPQKLKAQHTRPVHLQTSCHISPEVAGSNSYRFSMSSYTRHFSERHAAFNARSDDFYCYVLAKMVANDLTVKIMHQQAALCSKSRPVSDFYPVLGVCMALQCHSYLRAVYTYLLTSCFVCSNPSHLDHPRQVWHTKESVYNSMHRPYLPSTRLVYALQYRLGWQLAFY